MAARGRVAARPQFAASFFTGLRVTSPLLTPWGRRSVLSTSLPAVLNGLLRRAKSLVHGVFQVAWIHRQWFVPSDPAVVPWSCCIAGQCWRTARARFEALDDSWVSVQLRAKQPDAAQVRRQHMRRLLLRSFLESVEVQRSPQQSLQEPAHGNLGSCSGTAEFWPRRS